MIALKGIFAALTIGSAVMLTGCSSDCCPSEGKCSETAKKCPADCSKPCCAKK